MKDQQEQTSISVVICTYNRAELLRLALESMELQAADPSSYEVIVVDNNSSDGTGELARSFAARHDNYSVVVEPAQGLSHARNRGYREARGTYVAYLDDDAKAAENWLAVAVEIIHEYDPDIFGGPIYPFYMSPKPEWFRDVYEIREHAPVTGWMKEGFISGSNMVFKKSILDGLGGFDTSIGMKGNILSYGEETALLANARKAGYNIYYSHDLKVSHLVPDYKMNIAHSIFAYYKSGKDALKTGSEKHNTGIIRDVILSTDGLFSAFENALKNRDKTKYPYPENYFIEELAPQLYALGGKVQYLIDEFKLADEAYISGKIAAGMRLSPRSFLKSVLRLLRRVRIG